MPLGKPVVPKKIQPTEEEPQPKKTTARPTKVVAARRRAAQPKKAPGSWKKQMPGRITDADIGPPCDWLWPECSPEAPHPACSKGSGRRRSCRR